jgi:hypothetical protein
MMAVFDLAKATRVALHPYDVEFSYHNGNKLDCVTH